MSDYNRLDPVALDEHITGHYGEDHYPEEEVPMADTDHQTALRIIGAEAERHVRSHADEWLKIQVKRHESYSSIYMSDFERCDVCFAYATALGALRGDGE